MADTKFHTDEFYALKEQVKALDRLFGEKHESLKTYLESKLNGIATATDKALDSNNKRLEGMNEFRGTLKDQTATFITKDEFNTQHERVRDDIKKIELTGAVLAGKASQKSVNLALLISVISGLLGACALLFEMFKFFNH